VNDGTFGDKAIGEVVEHFSEFLIGVGCDLNNILHEWIILKAYMFPIISNNQNEYYLKIWEIVFSKSSLVKECRNILDIFELFLICPFTNAKVERMFSCMNRVKNDWRSCLRQDRLESLLRISEEGPEIDKFEPDTAMDEWYNDKVRRLSANFHRYPEKRKRKLGKTDIDLATVTISDLEESESEEEYCDNF
jgi:hypothetical protein